MKPMEVLCAVTSAMLQGKNNSEAHLKRFLMSAFLQNNRSQQKKDFAAEFLLLNNFKELLTVSIEAQN